MVIFDSYVTVYQRVAEMRGFANQKSGGWTGKVSTCLENVTYITFA